MKKENNRRQFLLGTGIAAGSTALFGASTAQAQTQSSGAINVKSFGASGDGSSDDSAAINAAVESLGATGGAIYFPQGTYLVKNHIKLRSHICYFGDGWSTIIKAHPESRDNVFGHYGPDYDFDINNVIIRDLSIDGNRHQVEFNSHNDGLVDDAYQNAIRLHRCKNTRILNCQIYDTVFNAISIYYASHNTVVRDCYIHSIGKVHNIPEGAYSFNGIFLEWQGDNITVDSNLISVCGQVGILLQTADTGGFRNCSITNNRIFLAQTNGILVGDQQGLAATGLLERITISGNLVKECGGGAEPAIRVRRTTPGFYAHDIVLTNNQVYDNNHIGMLVDTGVKNAIVQGNSCINNVDRGLVVAGENITVIGNIAQDNHQQNFDTSSGINVVEAANIT